VSEIKLTPSTQAVLQAIWGGYNWGVAIIKESGVSMTTVYDTLRRLRKAGWVTEQLEPVELMHELGRPRRRIYHLSPTALEALGWTENVALPAGVATPPPHIDQPTAELDFILDAQVYETTGGVDPDGSAGS